MVREGLHRTGLLVLDGKPQKANIYITARRYLYTPVLYIKWFTPSCSLFFHFPLKTDHLPQSGLPIKSEQEDELAE